MAYITVSSRENRAISVVCESDQEYEYIYNTINDGHNNRTLNANVTMKQLKSELQKAKKTIEHLEVLIK